MTALRVAVIGLGVGEQHARAFAAHPSCTLACVYDIDSSRSAKVAGELGTVAARTEADVFEDNRVDVVSIASYDGDHARQVGWALKRGKHVFVEKPVCRTDDELRQVKNAWAVTADRHLASNLVLRGAPLYQWLRELVQSGELGDIYAFDGDYLYGRLHKITSGWRGADECYSVMLGGGVHLVDLMIWLSGENPRRVAAVGNRLSTRGTGFRPHDFVAATYEFPSGLVGRITANFGSVHQHQHVVRVFGTRGTFIYDDRGARLHRTREPNAEADPIDAAPLPESKGVLIPAFVDAIVAGRDTGALVQRELDVISACVAADGALARGDAKDIAYV